MNKIISVYRLLNILSIDVAAGAVICALFFARLFEVQIKPYGLISLGLTVWIIYTADHLLDGIKTHHRAATKRHQFHQYHFKVLCVVMIVAIIIDGLHDYIIVDKDGILLIYPKSKEQDIKNLIAKSNVLRS